MIGGSEIWKDIPGYKGKYEASNLGRIRSVERLKVDTMGRKRVFGSRQIKPLKAHHGYQRVNLYDNGIRSRFVHRLVASAFLERPSLLHQVNHKNGIKDDNRVDNLEWVTGSENILHSYESGLRTGRRGIKCNFSKLCDSDVLQIRKSGLPQRELAKSFNVSDSLISQIINKKVWTHI